jgi:hypothetical protein
VLRRPATALVELTPLVHRGHADSPT